MATTIGDGVLYPDGSRETSLKSPTRAIFGYGTIDGVNNSSITNLVSNIGVVATDTTGVGTL